MSDENDGWNAWERLPTGYAVNSEVQKIRRSTAGLYRMAAAHRKRFTAEEALRKFCRDRHLKLFRP